VILTSDPQALYSNIEGAFERSLDDMRILISGREPHRTGALDAGYGTTTPQATTPDETLYAYIVNPKVYANAVERGAWVRSGRGPHMKGNFLVRNTLLHSFGQSMNFRLVSGISAHHSFGKRHPKTVTTTL
jgi:hypothetical protein